MTSISVIQSEATTAEDERLPWSSQLQTMGCSALVMLTIACGCSKSTMIVGRVECDGVPIAGATVRIKGTSASTTSDKDGKYSLPLPRTGGQFVATATAPGFFIGGRPLDTAASASVITLTRLPTADNEEYEWVAPTPNAESAGNCGNCHPEIYDQWSSGAHASSQSGFRFMDLYAGTNQHNSQSVVQSWSLLRDRPEGAGVCTSCHAPSAMLEQLAVGDIRDVHGVAKQGVHCDYCHKVQSVENDSVGLTHGRFGMNLLRPAHGQLFFGPLDDVDRGEDAYAPLFSKSEFCAACHEGTVFGVHVYSTYSEWLDSPARREGKQCQDCHMKPDGAMTNIAPDLGGIERDPMTLASHQLFPGGKSTMLSNSIDAQVSVEVESNATSVTVVLLAKNVGHRIPTGFVDRHLVLLVEATDPNSNALAPIAGPKLPTSCGSLAGAPGRLFAKQLIGESGESPIPFWSEVLNMEDTRLIPGQPSETKVLFSTDAQSVRVRVIYRRFWEVIEKEKGWPDSTIMVYDQVHPVPGFSPDPK